MNNIVYIGLAGLPPAALYFVEVISLRFLKDQRGSSFLENALWIILFVLTIAPCCSTWLPPPAVNLRAWPRE